MLVEHYETLLILLEDIVMNNNKKNIMVKGLKKRTAVIGFVILLFFGGVIIFSDITKPYTFSDGDIISAGQMNENLDVLYTKVNELEDIIENLDPPPGGSNNVPVGTILPFGGDTDKIPEGWLLCDGTAYSISGNYSNLYDIIGGNFGYPNPGEFYVPDLRGMFLRGVDNGAEVDPDAGSRTSLQNAGNTGDMVGSFQRDAFQGHRHSIVTPSGASRTQLTSQESNSSGGYFEDYGITQGDAGDRGSFYIGNALTSGYGDIKISTETRPQNVYVNFIIKY
jgi:microcystin-dependent protein